MKMQIMTAFVFPAIAFQTETICATDCLHPSNNRKPISANTFPSPNVTLGFGCFKQQRKKKLDRQWPELNIVLPGRSQHPLRGYIFPSEIIASALLCICLTVNVREVAPHDRGPVVLKVDCILASCFLEVSPLLQRLTFHTTERDINNNNNTGCRTQIYLTTWVKSLVWWNEKGSNKYDMMYIVLSVTIAQTYK